MERDTQQNLLSHICPWVGVRPLPLVGAGVGLHRQLRWLCYVHQTEENIIRCVQMSKHVCIQMHPTNVFKT